MVSVRCVFERRKIRRQRHKRPGRECSAFPGRVHTHTAVAHEPGIAHGGMGASPLCAVRRRAAAHMDQLLKKWGSLLCGFCCPSSGGHLEYKERLDCTGQPKLPPLSPPRRKISTVLHFLSFGGKR